MSYIVNVKKVGSASKSIYEVVSDDEKWQLSEQLPSATPGLKRLEDENWFKVDWARVPELIENRTILLCRG
jgi:DNA primase large subunit